MDFILDLDSRILLFIQERIRNPVLDPVMKLASLVGEIGFIWLVFALVLFIRRKTRREGLETLACVGIATALNNLVIKNLAARPRPYLTVEGLTTVIPRLTSWSFPSGHACASFAAATALTLAMGRKWAWAFIPAALIAFSRVYNGVHFPTDVLFGAVLGTLTALAVFRLSRRFFV